MLHHGAESDIHRGVLPQQLEEAEVRFDHCGLVISQTLLRRQLIQRRLFRRRGSVLGED